MSFNAHDQIALSKKQRKRVWAIAVLSDCKSGKISRDSAQARRAKSALGAILTARILDDSLVTEKGAGFGCRASDAMFRRAPGSYGAGRR